MCVCAFVYGECLNFVDREKRVFVDIHGIIAISLHRKHIMRKGKRERKFKIRKVQSRKVKSSSTRSRKKK